MTKNEEKVLTKLEKANIIAWNLGLNLAIGEDVVRYMEGLIDKSTITNILKKALKEHNTIIKKISKLIEILKTCPKVIKREGIGGVMTNDGSEPHTERETSRLVDGFTRTTEDLP